MDNKILESEIKKYVSFLKKQPKGFAYKDIPEKKISECQNLNKNLPSKPTQEALNEIKSKYRNCQECPLCKQGRSQVVFGVGNPFTKLMFIGEGPGRDEDAQGAPFVGRAGQLLTKIIEAMKLTRDEVYISNVVKCRPPNNRTPLPNESDTCKQLILFKEIELIKPQVICALGATAVQGLLGHDISISKVRGNFIKFNDILVMPTYHPAYLLRNPDAKKIVWEDMKQIMAKLKELNP